MSAYSSFVLVLLALLTKKCLVKSNEVLEKEYYDLDLTESLFQNFIVEHQRHYTAAETDYRFKVFQENLKRINELNEEQDSIVFGLTSFSDLTPDEFKEKVSCLPGSRDIESIIVPNVEAPDHLDWRDKNLVTAVKDQEDCGSCYIFGAIGEIEGQYAKTHNKLISLSEQYPLDCSRNFTCHGGYPDIVMSWFKNTTGAIKEKDYPYIGDRFHCHADPKKGVVKVKNVTLSKVANSEELKKVLASHGPLAIGMFATDEMQFYRKGIMKPKNCPNNDTNHAVTLVGYGKEKENYWIIKNSWGDYWGEKGYLQLAFDTCAVGTYLAQTEVA